MALLRAKEPLEEGEELSEAAPLGPPGPRAELAEKAGQGLPRLLTREGSKAGVSLGPVRGAAALPVASLPGA